VGALSGPVRVLVVDDQALLRGSFRVLIDSAEGLTTVGEAPNGWQAVELARSLLPDVVLMDIRMPELDGIEAIRRICEHPGTAGVRVLVLTTFDEDRYVYDALRAGASGFVLKDTPPADLIAAIRVVARGDALLAPSVTRRLIADVAARPERRTVPVMGLDGVTERERQVLALIGTGLSNAGIAGRLTLNMATVKTYVGRLLTKLAARGSRSWSRCR
jgi:DNA-binding NarL/FixJ family response regulator